jgi:hypothetical protein
MRRLALALGAAALLAAACRVAPVHAGAPLIDEPAAPDAPVTSATRPCNLLSGM